MAKKSKPVKRPKFRVYSRFCSFMEKQFASKNVPEHLRGLKGWDVLREMVNHGGFLSPINKLIMSAEAAWEDSGMHALFVEQKDIDALLKGKYSLNKLPALFTPYKSFALCLPAEFSVEGIKPGGGVLVSTYPDMADYDKVLRTALEKVGVEGVEPPEEQRQQGSNIMTMTYLGADNAHVVLSYYGEQLESLFNSKNFAEYKQHSNSLSISSPLDMDLDEGEQKLQYTLVKLVLSISIFAMAKPDSIVSGFPKAKGFVLDGTIGDGVSSSSLTASFKRRSVTEHYRSWFLRQLSHEKYYQGEFKNLAPNTRFVFVEDTVVNSKVNPKHLDIVKK